MCSKKTILLDSIESINKKLNNFMKLIPFFFTLIISFNLLSFPVPKDGKISFDVIRKNKIIGSHEIIFKKNENELLLSTNINIEVKILFITAYKFLHQSVETWKDNEFIKVEGFSDFEDNREYSIKGNDIGGNFIAEGMDGKLTLDKDILPSNFWNINILAEKEIFDTQKGVVRKIQVRDLGSETIKINNNKIDTKKFSFNASDHPKDKGPFPEYTLWYSNEDELVKFWFRNPKDKKKVLVIRNDLGSN